MQGVPKLACKNVVEDSTPKNIAKNSNNRNLQNGFM